MITIPKLTDKDLEIFKGKKVVIWSYYKKQQCLYSIFKKYNIDVVAFYANNIMDKIRNSNAKLPVINKNQLIKLKQKHKNLIIQFSFFEPTEIQKATSEMESIGVEVSTIPVGSLITTFNPIIYLNSLKNRNEYKNEIKKWQKRCSRKVNYSTSVFARKNQMQPLVICLPMKTGDYTLANTFYQFKIHPKNKIQKLNEYIIKPLMKASSKFDFVNTVHKTRLINDNIKKKQNLKIITAVRDPISQNVSTFFQFLDAVAIQNDWILGELNGEYYSQENINKLEDVFIKNGHDIQKLFNAFIARYIYAEKKLETDYPKSIQQFHLDFKKDIFDITKNPFNKEKGYTIIKEGNIEVFVYQLEKLNNLVPELSEWVGVPFTELVRGNDASDKWIGDSYKQAQKEIEITQEYFDRCYSEPYVQHCYSQEDIEKFKARWRPHIKD
ncbi:MAG: putative capsular polysaccharide synthesis family protein [Clostridia bacterium]